MLYLDFEFYLEWIACLREEAMLALLPNENLQDAKKKPKAT